MKPLTKTIKSGMHLFHQNDRSRELYIIQSGTIKIYRISNGREIELATLGKGAVLGEMALIDGKPRSASAKAISDCEVIRIDADTFHEKIKDVPSWFMSIIKMTSNKIRQANCRLQNISSGHQGAKIIITLFYLFKHFDNTGDGLKINKIQPRLITLLGITHQNIVQMLDFLYQNSFIHIRDEYIFMADLYRYKEYCEFLRLWIRNGFEKMISIPQSLSRIILSLAATYPSVIASGENATDITETDFINICNESGLTDDLHGILQQLRSLNLLSFTREPPVKKTDDKTTGFQIKISNPDWKRSYLFQKFKNLKPVL